MYPRLKLALTAAALLALLSLAPLTTAATTFTVTKTADTNDGACNSDCSLREAIAKANTTAGTDTVKVPAGDFKLTAGELTITQAVAIDGAGSGATFLNGNAASRILSITGASTDVVLSDLAVVNGKGVAAGGVVQGGAINAGAGALTLNNCLVSDNRADTNGAAAQAGGVAQGGAIYSVGKLTLNGDTFRDNVATARGGASQGGGVPQGGAIYNQPTGTTPLTLTNTTFRNNTADAHGGTGVSNSNQTGGVAQGGALYINGAGALTVDPSTLTDNTADARGGDGAGGGVPQGAAVYKNGGGDVKLTDVDLSRNKAQANGGGSSTSNTNQTGGVAQGGAFYINGAGALTITRAKGNDNTTDTRAGDGAAGGVPQGSAVWKSGGGDLKLTDVDLSRNKAQANGGDNSTNNTNQTGGVAQGAGLWVSGAGALTITRATGNDNLVDARAGAGAAGGVPQGAVVWKSNDGAVDLTDVSFSRNSANAHGGTGTTDSNQTGGVAQGGGLWVGGNGALTVDPSKFTNSTLDAGSGAGAPGGVAEGGGIYKTGNGDVKITEVAFDANKANANAGTGTTDTNQDGGVAEGGGLYFGGADALTVTRSTASRSTLTAAGGSGGDGGVAQGGGIFKSGAGSFSLTNNTVSGNTVDAPKGSGGATGVAQGGGLYSSGPGTLVNDTLSGNRAKGATTPLGGNYFKAGADAVTLKNTILAEGSAGAGSENCSGTLTSGGHNLEDKNTCGLTGTGDQKNTNPLLDLLANYGGPTETHRLKAGSPAIDKGTNSGCPSTDQRGGKRPIPPGGTCDEGAYERGALTDLALTKLDTPDPVIAGLGLSYTLTVKNQGSDPAAAVKLTDVLPAGLGFVSATPDQGSCSGTTSLSCSLGSLASGASTKVVVATTALALGQKTNTATVSADPTDPLSSNNTATATTQVIANQDPDTNIAKLKKKYASKRVRRSQASKRRPQLKKLKGTASDDVGVKRVEVAIVRLSRAKPPSGIVKVARKKKRVCLFLKKNGKFRKSKASRKGKCKKLYFLKAKGTTKWSFKLPRKARKKLPKGKYAVYARAVDLLGNAEDSFARSDKNLRTFKVG